MRVTWPTRWRPTISNSHMSSAMEGVEQGHRRFSVPRAGAWAPAHVHRSLLDVSFSCEMIWLFFLTESSGWTTVGQDAKGATIVVASCGVDRRTMSRTIYVVKVCLYVCACMFARLYVGMGASTYGCFLYAHMFVCLYVHLGDADDDTGDIDDDGDGGVVG